MIKCFCFDLDNTLYPEDSYCRECYKRIARIISPSKEQSIFENMLKIRNENGDSNVFQKVVELYGLDRSFINVFVDIYRTNGVGISAYNDVKRYLAMRKSGIKYGVLTNGGKYTQRNKLRCLGLEDKFDFVYITGEFLTKDKWKPNQKAFELVIKDSALTFNECLYIGDSFENDIVGALNVGMNAAVIDREAEYQKCMYNQSPYWIISSFEQISCVVKEIENLKYGRVLRNTNPTIK